MEPLEAAEALAKAMEPRAAAWFHSDPDACNLLARVVFLKKALPEIDLPDFSEEHLAGVLHKLCVDWSVSRLEQLDRISRLDALRSQLSRAQLNRLDQEAPESLTLPNGRSAKLLYEPDRPPVLAIRVQELFGWTRTPRIAGGRVTVLLQILGPNYRPVQITDDLGGFWTTTYFQVRKDLRGRYPKHAWPEDPLNAAPIIKKPRT